MDGLSDNINYIFNGSREAPRQMTSIKKVKVPNQCHTEINHDSRLPMGDLGSLPLSLPSPPFPSATSGRCVN